MRRSLVKFSNPIGKHAAFLSSPFSTASGGAGGRGRGRGRGVDPKFDFVRAVPGKPDSVDNEDTNVDPSSFQSSSGHGRGVIRTNRNGVPPIPSVPGSINPASSATGRGGGVRISVDDYGVGRGGGIGVPGDMSAAGRGGGARVSGNNSGAGRGGVARVSGDNSGVGRGGGVGISVSGNESVPITSSGAGRGGGAGLPSRPDPSGFEPKKPEFIRRLEEEEKSNDAYDPLPDFVVNRAKESESRANVKTLLSGAGRGKPDFAGVGSESGVGVKQENRHLRVRQQGVGRGDDVSVRKSPSKKLNVEDATKNAMEALSRGGDGGVGGGGDRERMMDGGGRGGRGRGGRGFRGRGRGRGGRFGGRGGRQEEEDDDDDDFDVGDDADGEKFAQRIGPENMNILVEAFEEMSETVLPSPEQDALIEAMHVNYAIECEPEYMMGDFENNPDIDEKPPVPLREMFDKVKPFLMAYENIQSHEEYEEAVENAMKQVPLVKAIVDYYGGPDRVTAKQQMEELDRVAKTLPESAPDPVKRFANRAVLSLQSNPGWGFDKKCQFMDKLVWEVSQQYK